MQASSFSLGIVIGLPDLLLRQRPSPFPLCSVLYLWMFIFLFVILRSTSPAHLSFRLPGSCTRHEPKALSPVYPPRNMTLKRGNLSYLDHVAYLFGGNWLMQHAASAYVQTWVQTHCIKLKRLWYCIVCIRSSFYSHTKCKGALINEELLQAAVP